VWHVCGRLFLEKTISNLAHQIVGKNRRQIEASRESFLANDRPHGSDPCGRSSETVRVREANAHAVGMISVGNVMAAPKWLTEFNFATAEKLLAEVASSRRILMRPRSIKEPLTPRRIRPCLKLKMSLTPLCFHISLVRP